MPHSDIVASLVARIRSRERLYVGAFNADMSRLRAEFGHSPVAEALRRLETSERYQPKDRWDVEGHRRTVKIARLLYERRQ